MNSYNTLLVLALVIVWLAVIFKDDLYVNSKGGRGGGGGRSSGSRSSGSRFSGFRFRSSSGSSGSSYRSGSYYRSSSSYRSGYYSESKLSEEQKLAGNNKLKVLAATIIGAGVAVPIAGGIYDLSNRYAYNKNQSHYYKYTYRSNEYSLIDGSYCTNNQSYDGIIYGRFQCPIEGFKATDKECCGLEGEQFCCAQKQEDISWDISDILLLIFIFSSIFICVFGNSIHNLYKKYFDTGYTQTQNQA